MKPTHPAAASPPGTDAAQPTPPAPAAHPTPDGGDAGGASRVPAPAHPPATPFTRLGGEPAVRALVDRFYDLMDLDAAYAGIRRLHPTGLDSSRDKLHWFLCGWLGGPNLYIERFGHPRLRARHLPFPIGLAERDQWLACMAQAMAEQGVAPDLAASLRQAFFGTADWMRNRAG